MINGVLVERTVKDVLPALQTNSDGLKKVLEELVKQYKRQQEEMEKWKVSSNLGFGNLSLCLWDSSTYYTLLTCRVYRKRTTSRSYNSEAVCSFTTELP